MPLYLKDKDGHKVKIAGSANLESLSFPVCRKENQMPEQTKHCPYRKDASGDFAPCINPSGNAGLYDLVSGNFFSSYFSGTITSGFAV